MPYSYKIDILTALKEKGYSQYRLRKEGILGQDTIRKLRDGDTNITLAMVVRICQMLECDPDDILNYEK